MENNNEKRIKLTWNKKVISISFLVLALFMLLAVSYAYFTATVVGNDQAKDITVEAARMSLELSGPDQVKLENALPGTEVKSEFTVTNTGTVQTTYNLDMIDVENNFDPASDLVYSITSTNDGGHAENVVAPQTSQTLIRNILIQPGEENAQVYTLTVRFRETGVDQNSNQGKRFTGRVQINKLTDNSLAAAILRANPIQDSTKINFSEGSPQSDGTENGTGLFVASDDEGASYYFRGDKNKINNNVFFAGKNWKIIRINGDGSIRLNYNDINNLTGLRDLLYASDYTVKYAGYTFDNNHDCTQSSPCISDYDNSKNDFILNYGTKEKNDNSIKNALEEWYKNNLVSYDNKIALTTFCNDTSIARADDSGYSFSPSQRLSTSYEPTLKCPNPTDENKVNTHNYGGVYKLKIGLMTVDEINVGGIASSSTCDNFLDPCGLDFWWTLSPWRAFKLGDHEYFSPSVYNIYNSTITSNGSVEEYAANAAPVINLKPDVTFTGTGTEDDPYVVE